MNTQPPSSDAEPAVLNGAQVPLSLSIKSLWQPIVTAGVLAFLFAQRHAGFMVIMEVLFLVPWTLWSAWVIAVKPQPRRLQSAKLGIWWLSVALIVGVHYVRATTTRASAQQVVDAVLAYRTAHGVYPADIQAIGYTKDQLRDMIGFGGYFMKDKKPLFFYASTYVAFETDHYDFARNEWTHIGD
jgi:hypothetical protein